MVDKLKEIKERHESDGEWETWCKEGHKRAHDDRGTLIGMVEDNRAHIEGLDMERRRLEKILYGEDALI